MPSNITAEKVENTSVLLRTPSTHIKKVGAEKMFAEAGSFSMNGGESVGVRLQGKWNSIIPLVKEIQKILQQYVISQYRTLNMSLFYNHKDKKTRAEIDPQSGRIYLSLYQKVGSTELSD